MLALRQDLDFEVALFAQAAERFARASHRTSGEELAFDLVEVSRCIDLVQLKFSEMAAGFAATNHYDLEGACSPLHWIRRNCHLTSGAAAGRVAVGEQIDKLPESVESLAAGEIGFGHLMLIAHEASAQAQSGSACAFDEVPLIDKAKQFTVGRFRNFCHHHRHANDAHGYAVQEAEAVEARSLELNIGEGGMVWIRGVLDPEGGAIVRNALEPLAQPNGDGDYRKRDKRLADGLVELASHGSCTQLNVTASLETLLQHAGSPAADVEMTQPLSGACVQRLSCECKVARILLDAESQVIEVGRSKRVVTAPQRRALEIRDRGCRWPGCERPASFTAAHHLIHWSKGGATDIENLVLLCHRHHWMVHEGRWQIVRTATDSFVAVPPQLFDSVGFVDDVDLGEVSAVDLKTNATR